METNESILEPLIERVEEYSKSSFELLKLKVVDKTADVVSTVFSRIILIPVLMLIVISLSIAGGLWWGELLGKTYYGFLFIAALYAVASIVLFLLGPKIKSRACNFLITQILK
jgi:hypothetical protein